MTHITWPLALIISADREPRHSDIIQAAERLNLGRGTIREYIEAKHRIALLRHQSTVRNGPSGEEESHV